MFQEFYDAGAEGYDLLFGRVPRSFAPPLLRTARMKPGQHILEVATGTGLVAEGIATIIGRSGRLIAVDISRAMLACAERRLRDFPQIALEEGDAQALRFGDEEFDAVVCSLALMLFPDPGLAASEMCRVLRRGGRVGVSVETTAQYSLTTRVNAAIGRHLPARAPVAAIYYSLGQEHLLRQVLERAGFIDVGVFARSHRFPFPSFDAYFSPIAGGAGSVGAEFASLAPALREIVREEIRAELDPGALGEAIEIEVRILFATGAKP